MSFSFRTIPLRSKGYEVFYPESENTGGITSCWREGVDMKALGERLCAEKITVSVRSDRAGRDYLRFSPHFYNTLAELRQAAELL